MANNTTRHDDSVQASLAELRAIEASRIVAKKQDEERCIREAEAKAFADEMKRLAAEQEAEERRLQAAYDRDQQRLAAEHEVALAKERIHAEANARVQTLSLEVALRKAEAEVLQAKATRPKRALGPLLVVAALLLAVQGAMFWQLSTNNRAHAERIESRFAHVDEQTREANQHINTIEENLAKVAEQAQSALTLASKTVEGPASTPATPVTNRPRPETRPSPVTRPERPSTPGQINMSAECRNNPLSPTCQ